MPLVIGARDLDPAKPAPLYSVIRANDGLVWNPAAKAFQAGDQVADADKLRPLNLVAGEAHAGLATAYDAAIPDQVPDEGRAVVLHDPETKAPITDPIAVQIVSETAAVVAVSISLGNR